LGMVTCPLTVSVVDMQTSMFYQRSDGNTDSQGRQSVGSGSLTHQGLSYTGFIPVLIKDLV